VTREAVKYHQLYHGILSESVIVGDPILEGPLVEILAALRSLLKVGHNGSLPKVKHEQGQRRNEEGCNICRPSGIHKTFQCPHKFPRRCFAASTVFGLKRSPFHRQVRPHQRSNHVGQLADSLIPIRSPLNEMDGSRLHVN
jgi:hypothetical protein